MFIPLWLLPALGMLIGCLGYLFQGNRVTARELIGAVLNIGFVTLLTWLVV